MALAATIQLNITKQKEAMLFELRVLECLLADTVQYFEARAHRLEFLMESVLTEVSLRGYLLRCKQSGPEVLPAMQCGLECRIAERLAHVGSCLLYGSSC